MSFVARVYVLPKDEVLDPQGEAILHALHHLDVAQVASVRAGRLFELRIDVADRDLAEQVATRASEQLLANPVVDRYEIALLPVEAGATEGR